MRRWIFLITGIVALLVLALPVTLVYYAAFTESGLAFIVRHVPKRIGRAQLDLEDVHGTLARGVTVGRLEVVHERMHLRADGIVGRISLTPLLWQTIHSPDLRARNLFVQVNRRMQPPPEGPPRFLPPGLIISVDRARIASATFI